MAHECTALVLGSLAHQCTELRVGKQRGKSRKSKREGEYRIKSMTTSKSTWCAVYSVGVWEEEGGRGKEGRTGGRRERGEGALGGWKGGRRVSKWPRELLEQAATCSPS